MVYRNEYNQIGQLYRQRLHSSDGGTSFLYTETYGYNERGWIKQLSGPVFGYELRYQDALNGMAMQFSGNIANQVFTNGGAANTFNYSYDKLDRLTSGVASGMSEVISYDRMGNITTMNRDAAGTASYSYSGNRLTGISGGGLSTGSYSYDAAGRATTDGRTGTVITYNPLDLPVTFTKTGLSLTYSYDALGNKLRRLNGTTSTTTDYIAGIQYQNGQIDFIRLPFGMVKDTLGSYRYYYDLTDHLGNVRARIREHPTIADSLQVIQRENYYPFGMTQFAGTKFNPYLYNSKELQGELGTYDYGWRQYDPVIGRWNVPDPMAENHYGISAYAYVLNNPIKYLDPLGLDTLDANRLTDIQWSKFNQVEDVLRIDEVAVKSPRYISPSNNHNRSIGMEGYFEGPPSGIYGPWTPDAVGVSMHGNIAGFSMNVSVVRDEKNQHGLYWGFSGGPGYTYFGTDPLKGVIGFGLTVDFYENRNIGVPVLEGIQGGTYDFNVGYGGMIGRSLPIAPETNRITSSGVQKTSIGTGTGFRSNRSVTWKLN